MTIVDGHSWALSVIQEDPPRVSTPINAELLPQTHPPVVVQQHNTPPQKFVLLSAKVQSLLPWHQYNYQCHLFINICRKFRTIRRNFFIPF